MGKDKIVRLDNTVNNIINVLEDALDRAKNREIKGLGIIIIDENNVCWTAYQTNDCLYMLIGAASVLHYELLQEVTL
jgi:hypothetical protein